MHILRKTLQSGSSKPWPEILEEITGSPKMDAGPMLEYFKPLNDWLDQVKYNFNSKKHNFDIIFLISLITKENTVKPVNIVDLL